MVPRGFIGVVHLGPMPGDPLYAEGGFEGVEARALADAEALVRGGVDALIVENFGSVPFVKGSAADRLPAHQVALMTLVLREIRRRYRLPVGVNCLRNDALSALGIAAAVGAAFIRVNVHVGAMVTDQGLIEGEAHLTLRSRQALGAPSIAILADILVKHASPLGSLSVEQAASDGLHRGLADGIIVTGAATGAAVDPETLARARRAIGEAPLFIGSGLTPDTAKQLCPLADGAIVGTWLKRDGDVHAPVDEERVRALAAVLPVHLRHN